MALITGTPLGTINEQDNIYLDTPPSLWFQDYTANELNNPDADGFYWGLTGTPTYPVYEIECYEGLTITATYESNMIRCDTIGDNGQIQKLNSIDLALTLKTLLPFDTLSKFLKGGPVTTNAGATEKFGIGQPNNNQYWHVYGASVYDTAAGDYINFTGHRAQFVDTWTLTPTYGNVTTLSATLRLFADSTKPADQLFMTLIRADPSAI